MDRVKKIINPPPPPRNPLACPMNLKIYSLERNPQLWLDRWQSRESFAKIISVTSNHGRMNYKDTKPYMSAFLSVDLLTDFAAFCLTDFIDWRYIHSWFVFSTQLVNCCPHEEGTILFLCTVAPLLYLLSDLLPPPPLPNVQYIQQTVCDCGGGGVGGCWNVLWTMSFTLCFWQDSEPTKLLHHP